MASFLEWLWSALAKIFTFFGILYSAKDFTNIEYTDSNGNTLFGYLATPPGYNASDTTKTYPVALVFHAFNGMDEEPVYFADSLAKDANYVVFAPDLFRGVAAEVLFIPWNIFTLIATPQSRMDEDIDAALNYLDSLGTVDISNVVSGPGFCFGGSQALELSKRRTTRATVSLYGSSISELQDPSDNETWGLLGANDSPILGIYGALDMGPSVEEVEGFEKALMERNANYNITIYDDVGHAFVTPEAYESGDEQATAAWNQVLTFMNSLESGSLSESGRVRSRRDVQIVDRKSYRPTLSWIWDHMTDGMLHKGHANRHQG